MVVLDTDHMSLLEQSAGTKHLRLLERLVDTDPMARKSKIGLCECQDFN
jgi:hypothetical protein